VTRRRTVSLPHKELRKPWRISKSGAPSNSVFNEHGGLVRQAARAILSREAERRAGVCSEFLDAIVTSFADTIARLFQPQFWE
jgi:hypothetical protein